MKSYLSLIPISAKVHQRQNRMTLLCIVFSVFMVTAVFSMAEMGARIERARLMEKHGSVSFQNLFSSSLGQSLLLVALVLFVLILIAGVLMISSSMNSSVAQRTQFFGMMRCIGMSKRQITRFIRQENGITLLNPGSITLPKENSPHTYALLDEHGFTIMTIDHEVYQSLTF